MDIPDFLTVPTTTDPSRPVEAPSWLVPETTSQLPIEVPKDPKDRKALLESFHHKENEIIFETILTKLSEGIPLTKILQNDPRPINHADLMRWINRDPQRRSRYYEAQEIGSELIASEMILIADAENSLEDVQRSTLRINTRKFLIGQWSKKRYGETKQIEVSGNISITEALRAAQGRIIEGEVIDVENE